MAKQPVLTQQQRHWASPLADPGDKNAFAFTWGVITERSRRGVRKLDEEAYELAIKVALPSSFQL